MHKGLLVNFFCVLVQIFQDAICLLFLNKYFLWGFEHWDVPPKVQKIVPCQHMEQKRERDVIRFNAEFFQEIYLFDEVAHQLHFIKQE